MKKGMKLFSLLFISLAIVSFVSTFASATLAEDISSGISNVINVIQSGSTPIFTALLGSVEDTQIFAIEVLVLLLVMLVIYSLLSSLTILSDKTWLNFAIALIVSLIGMRAVPSNFFLALTIPSSAFVASIVLIVPLLLLVGLGAKIQNRVIMKVYYIAFAVVVLVLWVYNWDNTLLDGFRWIYPVVAILSLALLWFDGTIQNLFNIASAKRLESDQKDSTRIQILGEIRNLQSGLATASTAKDIRDIQKKIEAKQKVLEALK